MDCICFSDNGVGVPEEKIPYIFDEYCLLLVDGRQKSSRGMFLEEMAKVFEDLGCREADYYCT